MHCRQVLLKHAGTFRPMCVHCDIMERCPKKLLRRMTNFHKRAVATAEKQVMAGKHKEGAVRQELGRSTVRKISKFMLDVQETEKTSVLGMCAVHNKKCPVIVDTPVDFAGLRVHVAGVNCYDWSSMGSSQKWLGESMPIFMEWARERLLSLEDMIIVECVIGFDSDMLGELFRDSYNLEVLRVSPTLFGEPVERQRKYMILLKKDKLRWLPEVAQYGVEHAFCRLFARTMHLSGQEKFRAPEHEIQEHRFDVAAKKQMPKYDARGREWSFFHLATRAIQGNISAHEKALEARIGSDADRSHWIVNLRQKPLFTPAKQFIVPALLRSSKLWLFGLRRWPLPLELLEVQGWNIWGGKPGVTEIIGASNSSSGSKPETDPQEFRCEFVEALRSLPDKHIYVCVCVHREAEQQRVLIHCSRRQFFQLWMRCYDELWHSLGSFRREHACISHVSLGTCACKPALSPGVRNVIQSLLLLSWHCKQSSESSTCLHVGQACFASATCTSSASHVVRVSKR